MPNPPRPADWRCDVAVRLIAARTALGRTQVELAAELGVARSALANWETGRNLPDVAAMTRFADRHSVPLDWLYRGDPSALPLRLAERLLAPPAA